MERLRQTPSQTVGPFFAYSLTAVQYGYPYDSIANQTLVGPDTPGERIFVSGRVIDGQGNPIPDAVLELWQADTTGHYRTAPIEIKASISDEFIGFGRLGTGTQPGAVFRFETIKPGSTGDRQSPHINIILFMRGSLRGLYTRIYFSDEAVSNEQDALLSAIPPERRHTLVATQTQLGSGVGYHIDIHMQGDQETVFFDL